MGDGRRIRLAVIKQLKRDYCFLCQLLLALTFFTRSIPSTRNLSSIYPCRIRNVPFLVKNNLRIATASAWSSTSSCTVVHCGAQSLRFLELLATDISISLVAETLQLAVLFSHAKLLICSNWKVGNWKIHCLFELACIL